MEKRQRFTAEFKREAIKLLNTSGKPAAVVAWRHRKPSLRSVDNERLLRSIERLHREPREACGTERVWRCLREAVSPAVVIAWRTCVEIMASRLGGGDVPCARAHRTNV